MHMKRKSLIIPAIFIIILLVVMFVFKHSDSILHKEIQKEAQKYKKEDLALILLKNKVDTKYDRENVSVITKNLPLGKKIKLSGVTQFIGEDVYTLIMDYEIFDYKEIKIDNTVVPDACFKNSVLLFSLVKDLDYTEYKLHDKSNENTGCTYTYKFSRSMIENKMGVDVRKYATSLEEIEELLTRLEYK